MMLIVPSPPPPRRGLAPSISSASTPAAAPELVLALSRRCSAAPFAFRQPLLRLRATSAETSPSRSGAFAAPSPSTSSVVLVLPYPDRAPAHVALLECAHVAAAVAAHEHLEPLQLLQHADHRALPGGDMREAEHVHVRPQAPPLASPRLERRPSPSGRTWTSRASSRRTAPPRSSRRRPTQRARPARRRRRAAAPPPRHVVRAARCARASRCAPPWPREAR